jgi:hypothetical protein
MTIDEYKLLGKAIALVFTGEEAKRNDGHPSVLKQSVVVTTALKVKVILFYTQCIKLSHSGCWEYLQKM